MSDWPGEPTTDQGALPGPPPPPSATPGPGWWLASDGRYYPPEQAPGYLAPPPPPNPAYQSYAPPAPPMTSATTNGLAIASLVLGIIWIWWIGSILALIFGYIAKGQIDRSQGRQQGRGMAIAGIVLGWVGVGFLVLFVAVAALGSTTDDGFDVNTDPPDGVCDDDRYLQDPDC